MVKSIERTKKDILKKVDKISNKLKSDISNKITININSQKDDAYALSLS